ncbi:MAG TPA: DUF72 domain-containing protein [Syntrophales bacterium]|nr:DUF72 domain-containing protein [Syntrophales bacterium]
MKYSIRIGTSGWTYPHWAGVFYDQSQPKSRWLEQYAGHFDTVEVNSSFYRLPRPAAVDRWVERTPEDFLWAVKASRYITHMKKLRDASEPLARFFETASHFREKLGPILFMIPPGLRYHEDTFTAFLEVLPPGHRYAIEARNASWMEKKPLAKMKDFGISFCISDTAGRFPYSEAVTADFTYIRLHGSRVLYASEYTVEELQEWARKIRKWKRDAYVYFDNDARGFAPKNALRLKEIMKS